MASNDVLRHAVISMQHMIPRTRRPIPLHLIQIVLTIEVGNNSSPTPDDDPFFTQETVSFPFELLLNHALFEDYLVTTLEGLRINTDSPDCGRIVQEIMQLGLNIVSPYAFRYTCLYLKAVIIVDTSSSDSESHNYGMASATPSSVKEMIERITIEDGGKQNCVVCLEELEVGFEASRMPCSHIFHGDCIETWLKQAHSCPICRYKMPTQHDN